MKLGAGHNVLTAAINATTPSADNLIVAANANFKIKVVGYVIVATAATTVTWKRGTTALSGAMSLASNGGVSAPVNETTAWFETAVNEALNMGIGVGAVQGHVVYVLET